MIYPIRLLAAISGILGGTLWCMLLLYSMLGLERFTSQKVVELYLAIPFFLFLAFLPAPPTIFYSRDSHWLGWAGSSLSLAGLLLILNYNLTGMFPNTVGDWSQFVLGFNLLGVGLLLTGASFLTTYPGNQGIPLMVLGVLSVSFIATIITGTASFQGLLIPLVGILFGIGWVWSGFTIFRYDINCS
jgi:hypothetical protein